MRRHKRDRNDTQKEQKEAVENGVVEMGERGEVVVLLKPSGCSWNVQYASSVRQSGSEIVHSPPKLTAPILQKKKRKEIKEKEKWNGMEIPYFIG